MKYKKGQVPKVERNKNILERRQKGFSYNSIAREFHISKTRVGQIIKKETART